MTLRMELGVKSYDIIIERGALDRAGELLDLNRKVLIITDSGVPTEYSDKVARACAESFKITVPEGEGSKSFETLQMILERMLSEGFTRTDVIVAVGGGVCGDLAGFVSSIFMRGIDFYNIPTTLLSQVDSSIGGKTAINLAGVKNCVGAFHQPKRVIVDPNVLHTLPKRQLASGLAEAIKMAATCDSELFAFMEQNDFENDAVLDHVIENSLKIKKYVVEQDETEKSLRRVLNFGHTVGHGIESGLELGGLYHGECVALGMLPLCSTEVRARLISVLEKAGLPTKLPQELNINAALLSVSHDKKAEGSKINYVYVEKIGNFEFKAQDIEEFCQTVKKSQSI